MIPASDIFEAVAEALRKDALARNVARMDPERLSDTSGMWASELIPMGVTPSQIDSAARTIRGRGERLTLPTLMALLRAESLPSRDDTRAAEDERDRRYYRDIIAWANRTGRCISQWFDWKPNDEARMRDLGVWEEWGKPLIDPVVAAEFRCWYSPSTAPRTLSPAIVNTRFYKYLQEDAEEQLALLDAQQ